MKTLLKKSLTRSIQSKVELQTYNIVLIKIDSLLLLILSAIKIFINNSNKSFKLPPLVQGIRKYKTTVGITKKENINLYKFLKQVTLINVLQLTFVIKYLF